VPDVSPIAKPCQAGCELCDAPAQIRPHRCSAPTARRPSTTASSATALGEPGIGLRGRAGCPADPAADVDPCAASLSQLAAEIAAQKLEPPCDVRELFAVAGAGDAVGVAVGEEAARRIALHVLRLAATLDLPLVVLGGSVGADSALLEPVRRHLDEGLPAAGGEVALERVFQRRVRTRAS